MYLGMLELNRIDIDEEFKILNEVTQELMGYDGKDTSHSYKAVIKSFGHLNVYDEIEPFQETAVILDVYDHQGNKVYQKRKDMINGINESTYINANFIKTALTEECPGSMDAGEEECHEKAAPYGYIIAS